jgi:hypothetical protein
MSSAKNPTFSTPSHISPTPAGWSRAAGVPSGFTCSGRADAAVTHGANISAPYARPTPKSVPAYRPTLSSTVTLLPPGFTVSCPSRPSRLVEVTVIVTLWPDASEPDEGEAVSLPASEDPTAIE